MVLESFDWLSPVTKLSCRAIRVFSKGSTWDPSSTKYPVLSSTLFERGATFYLQTFKASYVQCPVTEWFARFRGASVEYLIIATWSKLQLRRHAHRRDLVTREPS